MSPLFGKTQQLRKALSRKLFVRALIIIGVVCFISAIIYDSQISAFIGLGLTFWGIIISYISSEEYVKKRVLEATILTPLTAFNENISNFKYNGQAIYLPRRYLEDTESNRVCIRKDESTQLPTLLEIQSDGKLASKNREWLLLTPPGDELVRLFERTLRTTFVKIDLSYLEQNLPQLLTEDLGIAETVQIRSSGKIVKFALIETIFADICKESKAPNSLGSPIASAIACALAKATGKLVTIRSEQLAAQEETIIVEYEMSEPPQEILK